MKLRLIFFVILIIVFFVFMLWRHPFRQADFANGTDTTNLLSESSNSDLKIPTKSNQEIFTSNSQNKPSQTQSSSQSFEDRYRQVLENKNTPISLYGKVIDQDGVPLPNVKIGFYIRHWELTENADSKPIRLEKITSADGRFEVNDVTGDGGSVEYMNKDKYELEPTQINFGITSGTFENPIVFKMWSTNIHEQLITGGKSFKIVPDGRSYFIDLATDTINEFGEGDLKVWIQYTNQIVHGQLYDWSAGIEIINGELLEEGLGSAMYEAPKDGYVPAFQFRGQIKGGQRGQIGERKFYLSLKNGQEYGQMNIDLIAPFNNQTPGLIRLSYVINPSGSRILR